MPFLVLPVRFSLTVLLLAATLVAGCDSAETSLYDPDATGNAAPVVESVTPAGVVLAGIDEITISGRNFSATPSDNVVTFDDGLGASASATVLEASTTSLRVRVPNLPNAALRLRVSVLGAPDFSAPFALPLRPSFLPFGDLDAGIQEEPRGIVGDGTGTLFVSVSQAGNSRGIARYEQSVGVRQPFVTSSFVWNDLTRGADGVLVGVRGIQAMFRLPAGGSQQTIQPVLPSSVRLTAVYAESGFLWAAGSAGTIATPAIPNIYRFSGTGQAVATPFQGDVSDLKVSNGFVYAAGVRGTSQEAKVWRLRIHPDGTLGPEEVVYDVAANQKDSRPVALAFATDGTLFVALVPAVGSVNQSVANPIIEVLASGVAAPLYPGVLPSPIEALAWGQGSTLYAVQSRRISGSGATAVTLPAKLFTIETRRQGAP